MSAQLEVHEGEFRVTEEPPQLIDLPRNKEIAWREMTNDAIVLYVNAAAEERHRLMDFFRAIEDAGKAEIERRMRENNATELAVPGMERVALEEQFTAYMDNLDAARTAAELLRAAGKDEEAAKIIKHIPEETIVKPAHDQLGARVSITAL